LRIGNKNLGDALEVREPKKQFLEENWKTSSAIGSDARQAPH
jgi:hypothetical protein